MRKTSSQSSSARSNLLRTHEGRDLSQATNNTDVAYLAEPVKPAVAAEACCSMAETPILK